MNTDLFLNKNTDVFLGNVVRLMAILSVVIALSFFIFVVQYKGMKVGEIMSPDPLSHEWNKKQNKGYGGIAVCLR